LCIESKYSSNGKKITSVVKPQLDTRQEEIYIRT